MIIITINVFSDSLKNKIFKYTSSRIYLNYSSSPLDSSKSLG